MSLLDILNNTRKRTLLIFLGVLYLSTLVTFGLIYWRIANKSSGEFFIFQKDININTKVNVFKKNLKIYIYNKEFDNAISDLIISEEYKKPIVKLSNDSTGNFHIFTFDQTLGELWANYYYQLFIGKGITHMKIDKVQEDNINSKIKIYKLQISFYRSDERDSNRRYNLYKNIDKKTLKKVENITLWIKDYPVIEEELFQNKYYYPLNFYFINLMENSMSFLDDSPIILKSIANGSFKYPLWNFMYFSAVTITTLGYGDILPNSTMVRILVMFETISGVLIAAMFGSCLFWNRRNK